MARISLRRYDVQATYAVALALISLIPVAGALYLVCRNYRSEFRAIIYSSEYYLPALLACLAVAVLVSLVALILGFNSAGQRRNERQFRSWFGFLLGGASLTAAIVVGIAFVMLRL